MNNGIINHQQHPQHRRLPQQLQQQQQQPQHQQPYLEDTDDENEGDGKSQDRQNLYKTELCREWSTSGILSLCRNNILYNDIYIYIF